MPRSYHPKNIWSGKGSAPRHHPFYNSTSVAQREQVFKKSKEEIKQIAIEGAKLVKKLSQEYEGNFLFEYSPESFTGTEPDYALEVCNAVLDVMQPTPDKPMIINLPVTVEMSMPHIYANQIEYCSDRLNYRDSVILSTHPHNDRGTELPTRNLLYWQALSASNAACLEMEKEPETWMRSL